METIALDSDIARKAGVNTTILAPGQQRPKAPPAFLYGPDQDQFSSAFGSQTSTWPVKLHIGANMTVYGPVFDVGAPLCKDEFIFHCDEIYLDGHAAKTKNFIEQQERLLRDGLATRRKVPGLSVILATNGHQIYGHWLVDFLPKLYLLEHAGFPLDSLRFLYPQFEHGFGVELLRLAGIQDSQLITYNPQTEIIEAETLLIPTLLRCHSDATPLFGDALRFLNQRIDAAHPGLTPGGQERIFLSRTKSNRVGRPLVNTQEIETLAQAKGFTLVYPEQLPLLEQVSLFRGAKEILGQYGSALHGTIFSSNVVTGCLQGNGRASAGFLQSAIGEVLGQPTGYVLGQEQNLPPPHVGFSIAAETVTACIEANYTARGT